MKNVSKFLKASLMAAAAIIAMPLGAHAASTVPRVNFENQVRLNTKFYRDTYFADSYATYFGVNGFWLRGTSYNANVIVAAGLAQQCVLTVPDPGAGTANFLLSAGAQTIAGQQTFTASPIFPTTGIILKGTNYNGTFKVISTLGQATTYTLPDAGQAADTVATLKAANAFTGVNTMTSPVLTTPAIAGAGAGTGTLTYANSGSSTTVTVPYAASTDTVATLKSANAFSGLNTFIDQGAVQSMGTGTGTYNPAGVLNMQVNSFSTTTGTGAQTGHTYTLPASSLVDTGRGIRIKAWGHTAANTNNKTVTVNFGATTFTTGAIAANAKDYYIDVTVVRTGASAQTWVTDGYVNGSPIAFATYASQTGTLTQTETGTLTVSTTLTDGSSSAGDIVESGFEVEAL